jgi:thymidylate synthase ThyX
MISAKVIADSISRNGNRITTFVLRYPRFIHSQMMTHRVFSRNTSSSRAIPVKKMIQEILDDPVFPVEWGKNKKGMQAEGVLDEADQKIAERWWREAQSNALGVAEILDHMGVHKQIVNRVLEPYMHVNVILTGTEFDNFFDLRVNHAAQPEIQKLAMDMEYAMFQSQPMLLQAGNWHIPFIDREERIVYNYELEEFLHISAARCARVSYTAPDATERNIEKDIELSQRLLREKHMSPFEHQAMCAGSNVSSGNFNGWIQFRKVLEK